ncbi:U11/U12 small nuclear ribonucleoprotein 35 kDa protein-like isoform X2 [Xenia sp. Carnegie-2017]|uniref:U11/U12 small nuclear ribonucleoprotein 35 kDa protein-like isoform X2 n=1 Tax=Xenia sp. Carnegie-2017 TaxID=2897299 RepID=UPI001F04C10B|nr:U11/U12 small nuclear ribonucleoprotein 35 kDa protein-like isoform X2 [Xenia sp. Carnegie-2017]
MSLSTEMGDKDVKLPYKLPTFHDWQPHASFYHPLYAGSIDGTDVYPHDKAVIRAMLSTYRPNKNVTGDQSKTLFVARLSKDTGEDEVQKIFEKYGHLEKCRLIRDFVTGFSKGYAFVEYKKKKDALYAARETHQMNINGRQILVDFECERNLEGWKPRRFGGGFGGKKESGQLRFGGIDRPFRRPLWTSKCNSF